MPNGYVSQIQINGGDVQNIGSCAYAVCDTLEDVVEKVVSFPNFVLKTGATIHVKFTYRNTAFNPKLNVNGTGAKSIVMNTNNNFDSSLNLDSQYNVDQTWMAGAVMTLTYADSCWIINNPSRITTPYTYNISTGGTLEVDSYIVLADLEWELCTGSSNVTARVFPFRICMSTMVDGIYRDRSAIMEVFVGGCYNKKDYVDIMISDESEYHADSSYVFRSLVDSIFVYFEYEVESGNVIGKRTGHLLGKVPSSWSTFQLVPLTDMSVASADPDNTHHFLKFDIAHSSSSFEPSAGYETSIPSGNTLPTTVGVHKYLIKARLKPFDIGQLSGDGSTAGQYLKSNGSGNAPSWETMDSSPTANSTKAVTSGGVKTALDNKANVAHTHDLTKFSDNTYVRLSSSAQSNPKSEGETRSGWLYVLNENEAKVEGRGDVSYVSILRAVRCNNAANDIMLGNYSSGVLFGVQDTRGIINLAYTTPWIRFAAGNGKLSKQPNWKLDIKGTNNTVITLPSETCTLAINSLMDLNLITKNYSGSVKYAGHMLRRMPSMNGLQGMDTNLYTIEYSTDGGVTWAEYPIDANSKSRFVSNIGNALFYGNHNGNSATTDMKMRITISYTNGTQNLLYAEVGEFLIYMDANGTRGNKAKLSVYKSNTDTWTELGTYPISGSAGWNAIPASGRISASSSYYQKYRIELSCDEVASSGKTTYVHSIIMICGTIWTGRNWDYNIAMDTSNQRYFEVNDSKIRAISGAIQYGNNYLVSGGTVYNAIAALDVTDTETANKAVTAVSETDGKIAVTRRTIGSIGEAVTFTQASYDAQHSAANEYQKVLTLAKGDSCVLNITKVVYGSPIQTTIWLSNGNNVDFSMLKECAGLVTTGGGSGQSVTLLIPVVPQQGYPHATLKIHVVRQTDDDSIVFHTQTAEYVTINHPRRPNIVMRDVVPSTNGSLAFRINGSTHIGSVDMNGYTDFVGMMTEDSDSAILIKTSNGEEGSVYRFTFDHYIDGGVSFSNSDASTVYADVSQNIHAGDTVTLTAVSNTEGGWIVSVSSAGIISSDNSVGIEWENGVADLKVERIPANIVKNVSTLNWEDDESIAIGKNSIANEYSGDDSAKYAYTVHGTLIDFKVNDGSNVKSYAVTAGVTYSVKYSSTTVSFTPTTSGNAVIVDTGTSSQWFFDNNHKWMFDNQAGTTMQQVPLEAMNFSTAQYILLVTNVQTTVLDNPNTKVKVWIKKTTKYSSTVIGSSSQATGVYSTATGSSSNATGSYSTTTGYSSQATGDYSTALGSSSKATGSYSTATGGNSHAMGNYSTATGYSSQATGVYSTATGSSSNATGIYSTATGSSSNAIGIYSTALGSSSKATGNYSQAYGHGAKAGYQSGDSTYPRYIVKRFTAIDFTEGGETKKYMFVNYGSSVTITLNGNSITLTPPNQNCKFFIIVNDSVANRAYRGVTSYARINGTDRYVSSFSGFDIKTEAVNGNSYYAMWLYGFVNDFPSTVDSFSILAYYKSTDSSLYQIAIGYNSTAIYGNSIAIGVEAKAIKSGQIVIGSGVIPNENDMLIIGNGSGYANSRGNILTIDSQEVMHVKNVSTDIAVNTLNGASVNIVQLRQGILKVVGGGTITLNATGAVEGTTVKVYASDEDVTCNGDSITAGRWREYLFIDGAWRSKM